MEHQHSIPSLTHGETSHDAPSGVSGKPRRALRALAALCAGAMLTCVLPFTTPALADVQVYEGVIDGAPYRFEVPDDWNGDVALFVHGYVFPEAPLTIPPVDHGHFLPLGAAMTANGFAVAYSAFSENGLAVASGARDSERVLAELAQTAGAPDDVFLVGFSMGSIIGEKLLRESDAWPYAGALAVCGAQGGISVQNQYFYDARLLFDYFYPGLLEGNVLTGDQDLFTEVWPAVIPAIYANPEPAMQMAAIQGMPWHNLDQLVQGTAFTLLLTGGGTGDIQDKLGGNPHTNRGQLYTGSDNDLRLNLRIDRIRADWRAAYKSRKNYDPKGRLDGKVVLHLHNTRDPIVPLQKHVNAYQRVLAKAGENDQYVVRTIDRWGHCDFTPEELLTGFSDLVAWVEDGVAPAP